MARRFLGAIWAQSRDGVIGDGSGMEWYLPEDLAHFKETTMGSAVLMGRATWESLDPRFRPLPGRENYVLSRRAPGEWSEGATVVPALEAAPAGCWVIGGGQVYAATIDAVDRLEITRIEADLADSTVTPVRAPEVPPSFRLAATSEWRVSERGRLDADGTRPRYRFETYERIQP